MNWSWIVLGVLGLVAAWWVLVGVRRWPLNGSTVIVLGSAIMVVIALPAIVWRFVEADDMLGFVASGFYHAALWASPFVLMGLAGWWFDSRARHRERGD